MNIKDKSGKTKGFLVYYDNEVIVCRLPDDEAGKLFKSLFPYGRESIKPADFESSPALAMAFDILSMAIDKDKEAYEKRCEKNRENIAKRWKENTTVYDRIPSDTNDTNNNSNSNSNTNINTNTNNKDIDYQLIADMYNATCVSFPRLTKLSEKRKKAIKARLRTYTVEDFKKLFELAEASSFLKGQNNRNWSATFDWLVTDANMAKVLDGNYVDSSSSYRNTSRQHATENAESDSYAVYHEMYKKLGPISPDDPFQ